MPFIEVIDLRLDLQGLQGAHAANAQHHFLGHPLFAKPAVQLSRNPAGLAVVFLNIRIQQVQRIHPVGIDFPHLDQHIPALDGDLHSYTGVLQKVMGVILVGVIGLAGGGLDVLLAIALLPADADAHQGEAVILHPLQVVSGQDAQATRVDFETAFQRVLHAEVGDGG